MHVLLVEDEPDLAEPVARLLEREGFEVSRASSASEARGALRDTVRLVILDVMLPEGEDAGFDFARSLVDGPYDGAILCVTARDSAEDRLRALDLGVDDYLLKPFSLRDLLSRVRSLTSS